MPKNSELQNINPTAGKATPRIEESKTIRQKRDLIAATGLVILLKMDSKHRIFQPVWPWNLMDDLKKINRAPLPYYIKFCASFRSHWWIQTGVTVRKRPIWVKFCDFWSHVTLKFDRRPRKTLGHPFYAASSFVHHFVAIGEIKLELQSGNA